MLFSGYATAHFKLFVFVLSAVICALGGALYVPQVGIINPSEMAPDKSLESVVWCAVGGRGSLAGPILGAIAVNALKSYATRAFPEQWLYLLGGMFRPLFSVPESPDLAFRANLSAFLQLAARQEDPDTLFISRELSIEGDTELGLIVKNMLDAIEWPAFPLFPGAPAFRH